MRSMLLLPCFLFLAGSASLAEAGMLRVTPSVLDIAAPGATSSLSLRNEAQRTLHVQLRIFRWTLREGQPSLEPTAEAVVSPPSAALVPGQDYVVRVVRTTKQPLRAEESYRVLVDELPDSVTTRGAGVRFAIRYSIPVFFFTADSTPPAVLWSARANGTTLTLTASNTGARRLRVANLKLSDGRGAVIVRRDGLVGYALGNSSASWTFAKMPPAQRNAPLGLSADGESGPINASITPTVH